MNNDRNHRIDEARWQAQEQARRGDPDADADDLLTEVSSAGRTVAHALDGAVRGAGQAQRARVLRVGPRRPQMVPLGHGLFVSDGEVVLGHERLLEEPTMPLRAAVLAARESRTTAPARSGSSSAPICSTSNASS